MSAQEDNIVELNQHRDQKLDERSDDDLMLLTRGGRKEAFAILVQRHQLRALKVANRYTGDINKSKDIVQNTFLEIYRYVPRYQAQGLFNRLLMRILVNQCRMGFRSQKSVDRVENEMKQIHQDSPALPDETILARERNSEVNKAMSKLSDKLRTVLILRFSSELSYNEIAQQLDIPVGTVKSRIAAGIEKLRSVMQGGDTA